jgi:putative FmdB family regulatory protein
MPLYEYGCLDAACGDRTEVLQLLREYEAGEKPDCPTCHGPMQRIMLPSWQRAGNGFQPIVIHELPDGTFSFPMHGSAPLPDGAQRREITTFAEADRVMRKVNQQERSKSEQHVEQEQAWREEMESANRSDLRQRMQSMSPRGRAFAEFCMRANDQKPQRRTVDPNVYLEIREFDRSNRDAYRDQETGWRERRG